MPKLVDSCIAVLSTLCVTVCIAIMAVGMNTACSAQKPACQIIRIAQEACVVIETADGQRVSVPSAELHAFAANVSARQAAASASAAPSAAPSSAPAK
jgi:hypothetical protein